MSIENKLFELTGQKAMPNDPVVEIIKGFRDTLKDNIQDFEEKITELNSQQLIRVQNELGHAISSIQMQLDGSNEYFVGNSSLLLENLEEKFNQLLSSLDDKNKDLNFVLAKIQGDYDKLTDERFEAHFKKIADEQAKTIKQLQTLHDENLKRQSKIDTSKQRDVLMGGCGFVVGVIVCLLVFFIVK